MYFSIPVNPYIKVYFSSYTGNTKNLLNISPISLSCLYFNIIKLFGKDSYLQASSLFELFWKIGSNSWEKK